MSGRDYICCWTISLVPIDLLTRLVLHWTLLVVDDIYALGSLIIIYCDVS